MKRGLFLRTLTSVAVAMFVAGGLFGQVADGDYQVYDANRTAPTNIDYVTLKAAGTTMGYYALPDPYFHPNYDAGNGWALTAGFVWNWTAPSDPGTPPAFNKPGAANYVEITYSQAGIYNINVAEESPAAYGGCADASPTVMNVTVIDPPSALFTTADITSGLCGDQAAQSVAVAITEAIPDALGAFAFAVSEVVENLDAGGTPVGAPLSTTTDYVDFPTSGKANSGTAGMVAATPTFTYTFNSSAITVQNSMRTRYTYTLLKATDAPGAAAEGIISAISEKSDYISGTVNTYPFGAKTTTVFVVNPAPATGPIYYIPNNFEY